MALEHADNVAPVMPLIARLVPRVSLRSLIMRGREPELPFRAVRTIEVELSQPFSGLVAETLPDGTNHCIFRVLVRLHHHPLGLIVVDVADGPLSSEALKQLICENLGHAITAHLEADLLLNDLELINLLPVDGECRSSELASNSGPLVSVIICTLSRPRQLRAAVRALLGLSYENFEVIIVDNGPSDPATLELVESEFAQCPNVKYVSEPTRGLSVARNSGIAAARGDIIAFTDDDIVVDKEWLSALVSGFDEAGDIACVTGLTLASELDSPAQQLFEQYGAFNKGYETLLFDRDVNLSNTLLYPYSAGVFGGGGNCAVRLASLEGELSFDRRLGPGSLAFGAEDLDVFLKIIESGKRIRYVPVAIAWHEHRRSYPDLRWQMFTYGAGFAALLTKWIFTDRRVGIHIIRRIPRVLGLLRQQTNEASAETVPRDLRRLERLGYLYGPIAFLRSAVALRRGRRPFSDRVEAPPVDADLQALLSEGQLLVISPHLDDAVFSCSSIIKGAHHAVVHTVFAGDAPSDRPLLQWDRDCGFREGDNVMDHRRSEERIAAGQLGATVTWDLELQEGYRPGDLDSDAVVLAISNAIEKCRPAAVLFPLGLVHTDHVAVAAATMLHIGDRRFADIAWFAYADKPYADRRRALVRRRLSELESAGLYVRKVGLPWRVKRGDLGAVRSYASQLKGLRTSALRLALRHERVWRVLP